MTEVLDHPPVKLDRHDPMVIEGSVVKDNELPEPLMIEAHSAGGNLVPVANKNLVPFEQKSTEVSVLDGEAGQLELLNADDEVMRVKQEHPDASASERAIYWNFLTPDEYKQMSEADFQKFENEAADEISKRTTKELGQGEGHSKDIVGVLNPAETSKTSKEDVLDDWMKEEVKPPQKAPTAEDDSWMYEEVPESKSAQTEVEGPIEDGQDRWDAYMSGQFEQKNTKPKIRLMDRLSPYYWIAELQTRNMEKMQKMDQNERDKSFKRIMGRILGATAVTAAVTMAAYGATKGYLSGDEHAHFVGAGHDLAHHGGMGLHEVQGDGISDHQAQIMDHVRPGEAPEHLFRDLGKSEDWIHDHARTLADKFPADFSLKGGSDLRLEHRGALSNAAQQYIATH